MERSKPLRWWIVEDALCDRRGHWFEYLRTFQTGLAAEGDNVRFFASRECSPEVAAAFGAQSVLPKSIWARMSDGASKWRRLLRIPAHALDTYRVVSKLLADCSASHVSSSALSADRTCPDLIFVPTVLVHHLLGWIPLIKGKLRRLPCRVLLFFPNAPVQLRNDGTPELTPDPTAKLFRVCIRSLATEVVSGRVVLGAETRPMVKALSEVTGVPFTYLPHPVELTATHSPAPRVSSPAAENMPVVFGCYGPARHEKGSDVLQAAIRSVLEAAPEMPARFCFQWLGDFDDEQGRKVVLDPWLKAHPKVEIIDSYFTEGGYAAQLAATDVMVLPYRTSYRLRVSRVVIEAMVLGKPVIVTSGTTLHDQAQSRGAAVACEDGSPESLASAIRVLLGRYESVARAAAEQADAASHEFSVHAFREMLAA